MDFVVAYLLSAFAYRILRFVVYTFVFAEVVLALQATVLVTCVLELRIVRAVSAEGCCS